MELLARCRDLALPFYCNLLRSSQQSLRDRLFEQAEKGSSNADQRVYFDAIQALNDTSVAMQSAFDTQLQHSYQLFLIGRDEDEVAPVRQAGSLSLVAREQLEDELAISMIVSRASTQHAEPLWRLNRRLAVLRGGRKVSDDSNPFGPAKVGLALRQAMSELSVDPKARIFIYKHLGKLLLAVFGKVFNSLNDALIEGGVLPNLKLSINKAEDVGVDEAVVPPPPAAEEVAATADQRRLYNSIIEQFRHSTAQRGPRRQTASGISYGGLQAGQDGARENFRPHDYAMILSALQQAPDFNAGAVLQKPMPIEAVEQRLFAQLGKQANPDDRHQLAEHDADTVDLVGMVFRYMLDDPKIPDVVKSLLSHLHTPYLKLAILDKTFLEDQKHNARMLINRMAEAGARWVTDEKERVVLPKLKSIVETILRGFVDDISLFERLLADFERFRDNLDKRAEMVEKRNRSAQEGIERLGSAKQRAGAEIDERIQGYTIPESIQQLLRKPWTDFLAFNFLRNGEHSLSWKAALKVVDGVIWSVRDVGARSRDEFQRYQQQLEQSIAEGLRTIGYDSDAAEELLSALREAQEQAYEGHAVVTPVAEPVAKAKTAAAAESAAPEFTPAEQEYVELLRERVDFGTLFEFDRPGQRPLQCKLAWFSRVSAHYMFVNQAGIKQVVETLPNLARGMSLGSIRIVQPERRSFMERALTTILAKLNIG